MNHCRIFLILFLGIVSRCKAAEHNVRRVQAATVPDYHPDPEIRGGADVTSALSWYAVFAENVLCGGVLVHTDIVVTTASCVFRGGAPNQLRIGSLHRTSGGSVVNVERVKVHPDWNGNVIDGSDIAVIKINRELGNVVAVMNTVGNIPQMDAQLFVMGFGLTSDDTLPDNLQGLFYPFEQLCQNDFDQYDPTAHLCADATPQRGTCAGDGGSPAVLSGTNTVVGLSSFSDNRCESQTVDVFTRMSTYEAWVQHQICNLSADKPSTCPSDSGCLFFNWAGLQQGMQRFFGF